MNAPDFMSNRRDNKGTEISFARTMGHLWCWRDPAPARCLRMGVYWCTSTSKFVPRGNEYWYVFDVYRGCVFVSVYENCLRFVLCTWVCSTIILMRKFFCVGFTTFITFSDLLIADMYWWQCSLHQQQAPSILQYSGGWGQWSKIVFFEAILFDLTFATYTWLFRQALPTLVGLEFCSRVQVFIVDNDHWQVAALEGVCGSLFPKARAALCFSSPHSAVTEDILLCRQGNRGLQIAGMAASFLRVQWGVSSNHVELGNIVERLYVKYKGGWNFLCKPSRKQDTLCRPPLSEHCLLWCFHWQCKWVIVNCVLSFCYLCLDWLWSDLSFYFWRTSCSVYLYFPIFICIILFTICDLSDWCFCLFSNVHVSVFELVVKPAK